LEGGPAPGFQLRPMRDDSWCGTEVYWRRLASDWDFLRGELRLSCAVETALEPSAFLKFTALSEIHLSSTAFIGSWPSPALDSLGKIKQFSYLSCGTLRFQDALHGG